MPPELQNLVPLCVFAAVVGLVALAARTLRNAGRRDAAILDAVRLEYERERDGWVGLRIGDTMADGPKGGRP